MKRISGDTLIPTLQSVRSARSGIPVLWIVYIRQKTHLVCNPLRNREPVVLVAPVFECHLPTLLQTIKNTSIRCRKQLLVQVFQLFSWTNEEWLWCPSGGMEGIPRTAEMGGKAGEHDVYSGSSWTIFPRVSENRIWVCQVSQKTRSTRVPSSDNVLYSADSRIWIIAKNI